MSERRPRVTAGEAIHALERAGFSQVRQSGSHRILRDAAGRRATVPYHQGVILHPKVLASILKDAELTWEEFDLLMRS